MINLSLKKSLFLLLSLFVGRACILAQPITYDGQPEIKIGFEAIQYLPSSDTILKLAQAKSIFEKGLFTKNKKPDLNLGIANDNYWVAFSILNTTTTNQEVYINLENPRLNEVEVYIMEDDSLVQSFRLGDFFPFQNREIQYAQFAFPLKLNAATPSSIFLFIKHKGNTLQMPVRLLTRNAFLQQVESNYLFAGTVSGIFLIAFFFGFFFLINTKDPLFIYYSGYILTAGAWLWTTEGFAFQYFWPNLPELATRLGPGISALSAVFFLANCLQFCKPYDSSSRFRKVLQAMLVFLLVWSCTPFLPFVSITETTMTVYLSVYFIANIILCFLLLTYLARLARTQQIVLYYLMAVLVTISCSIAVVAKGGGIIQLPVSTGTVMSMGYVLELILMTAGITKQFYRYRQEKEEALLANIEQQKSINEKIVQTQNQERNRISRELHDDIGPRITQITMISESAKRNLPTNNPLSVELAEITNVSRNLVANMGEIVWSLNPENRTLRDLLSFLREQLHKLLEYSGMEYSISFEPDDDCVLNHSQLRNILLVTKEIVHNAVKHSHATNINIACRTKDNQIHFSVSDNGKGIDLTKATHGNGMRNIRQRIEEVGGALSIETEIGKGALFIYSVPF